MGSQWPKSGGYEFDNSGTLLTGCEVYIFEAGTTTPKATYAASDESGNPQEHPVEMDGNRWPLIFVPFGSYKYVIKTSGGTTLFTADDVPNEAPTDPGEGVDADAIAQTGDYLFVGKNGSRSGYVRCNGRTIGSATSSATERANADTEDLFVYIWNNYADAQCAVSGGRGATGAADFAANKRITLPDHRSAALIGFDDMGNTAASLAGSAPVVSGSAILAGSIIGANTHTLLTAQMPVTTPAGTISQVTGTISQITPAGSISQITPAGSVSINDTRTWFFTYSNTQLAIGAGGGTDTTNVNVELSNKSVGVASGSISGSFSGTPTTPTFTGTPTTPTFTGGTPTFTGSSFGSGSAHNILSRSLPVTVLMKL